MIIKFLYEMDLVFYIDYLSLYFLYHNFLSMNLLFVLFILLFNLMIKSHVAYSPKAMIGPVAS